MVTFLRASVLAFVMVASGGALAQPKPALVKDIDQPGRAKYQETQTHSCQGSSSNCYFFFSPVPAGKRLIVTWANAVYDLADSNSSYAILYLNETGGTELYLLPLPDPWAQTSRVINTPVMMYVEAGSSPAFQILTGSLFTSSPKVTLVGYYIAVP